MKLTAVAALIATTAAFAGSSPAAADCQCAANGTRYEQGAVVCLELPNGQLLARCGKVLNNSSWKKLQDGCPVSLALPDAPITAQLVDPVTASRPD